MTSPRRISRAGTLAFVAGVGLSTFVYAAPRAAAAPSGVLSADRVLAAHGVSPSSAAHQTGLRNYAGPNCPGAGWNCTTARAVVQNAPINGVNIFDCTPSSGGTSNQAGDNCVVVQSAQTNNGTNSATCHEEAVDAAPAPMCSITQANTGGANKATVKQVLTQTAGDSQTGQEQATVTQTNTTGANTASIKQELVQKIEDTSSTQTQAAAQFACIQQDSAAGSNTASVIQSQNQSEKNSNASGVTQNQNVQGGLTGTCGTVTTNTANLVFGIEQDQQSGSDTGTNSATSSQTLKQKEVSSPSAATVSQTQGDSLTDGGLDGHIDQNSTGLATANASQFENQYEDSEAATPGQTQFGPARCCSVQMSNPSDTFKITQQSAQDNDTHTGQMNEIDGKCQSSGLCTVNQTITEDGTTQHENCSSPSCNDVYVCAGTDCPVSTGGGTAARLGNRAYNRA